MFCRNCGKEIKGNVEICIHCGTRPFSEKNFCQECGAETRPNQEICLKCGVGLRSKPAVVDQSAKIASEIKFCRSCGKAITEKTEICMECGIRPLSEKNFCQECGAQTRPNQEICIKCGVRLKYHISETKSINSPKPNLNLSSLSAYYQQEFKKIQESDEKYSGKWNWAAFFWGFFWAFSKGLWFHGLIALIGSLFTAGGIGIVYCFIFGIRGNFMYYNFYVKDNQMVI